MPKFTKHLNESRARLRDALEAKADATAALAVAQSRIDRLQSVIDSLEPARAALAAFDSEYAAALAIWARVTGSPLPKIDAEQRSVLVSDLADAEAQAGAAQAAMATLQSDAGVAAEAASAAHKDTWIAARRVLIDEAMTTLPALADAIAKVFAEKRKIDAARQTILSELRSDDPAQRELFTALGEFDRSRQSAETIPFGPHTNEHHAEWQAFAAALLASAEASLGDGATLPRVHHFAAQGPDPVVAASLAADAFPTTSIMR